MFAGQQVALIFFPIVLQDKGRGVLPEHEPAVGCCIVERMSGDGIKLYCVENKKIVERFDEENALLGKLEKKQ